MVVIVALQGMKALDRFYIEAAAITWQSATSNIPSTTMLFRRLCFKEVRRCVGLIGSWFQIADHRDKRISLP